MRTRKWSLHAQNRRKRIFRLFFFRSFFFANLSPFGVFWLVLTTTKLSQKNVKVYPAEFSNLRSRRVRAAQAMHHPAGCYASSRGLCYTITLIAKKWLCITTCVPSGPCFVHVACVSPGWLVSPDQVFRPDGMFRPDEFFFRSVFFANISPFGVFL